MQRRLKPRLVALSGHDGVGKTTQVGLLIQRLRAAGFRVRETGVARSHNTVAYLFWKFFGARGYVFTPKQSRAHRSIWGLLELVGVILKLIGIRFLHGLGYSLVSERHIIDFIVSLSLDFLRDSRLTKARWVRVLLNSINDHVIYIRLTCSRDEILRRRLNRGNSTDYYLMSDSGPRHLNNFLRNREIAYRRLEKEIKAHLVPAEGAALDVHEKIWGIVREQLRIGD